MTYKQIQRDLNKIYKERRSWNGSKGPFDGISIMKRELIVAQQYTLYNLIDAKKSHDKKLAHLYQELYEIYREVSLNL